MEQATPSRASVEQMFNRIAHRYDFLNRLLSFGIDRYWRAALAKELEVDKTSSLLDCATGTADQLIALMQRADINTRGVGIDPATKMLCRGTHKLRRLGLDQRTSLIEGFADTLPFSDQSFDFVSMAFGIRNVVNVPKTLQEMRRVLKPQGKLVILEFSLPTSRWIRFFHQLYLQSLLPCIGRSISHDPEAYSYLSKTIRSFPSGEAFCSLMYSAGFKECRAQPLTQGIVTLYVGKISSV